MDKFRIGGGCRLRGSVRVGGSKNATLPILAATLLTDEPVTLRGIPDLRDVRTMGTILESLGREGIRDGDDLVLRKVRETEPTASYELVRQMRGSFCVLGPLLARHGQAKVSLPGGCVIGQRPIDLHLKGLAALGATIDLDEGYVLASGKLRGTEAYIAGANGPSVLGTANIASAAVLAEGRTILDGVACEPEIQDLLRFLVAMGARIEGIGSTRLVIDGVETLHGTEWTIPPDRIEAGTFVAAAGITDGDLEIENAPADQLGAVIDAFRSAGLAIEASNGSLRVRRDGPIRPTDITTYPYPGFPTDLQAQFMVLQCQTDGIALITDRVFPDRFMHVAELSRMGARIRQMGATAVIEGVRGLTGAPIMASDLRASAALVLAALAADGETLIDRVYHIDRGYERIEEKLRPLGAAIERVED